MSQQCQSVDLKIIYNNPFVIHFWETACEEKKKLPTIAHFHLTNLAFTGPCIVILFDVHRAVHHNII